MLSDAGRREHIKNMRKHFFWSAIFVTIAAFLSSCVSAIIVLPHPDKQTYCIGKANSENDSSNVVCSAPPNIDARMCKSPIIVAVVSGDPGEKARAICGKVKVECVVNSGQSSCRKIQSGYYTEGGYHVESNVSSCSGTADDFMCIFSTPETDPEL